MKLQEFKERVIFLVILLLCTSFISFVIASPIPPTVNYIKNETMGAAGSTGTIVNLTGNGTFAGGYIFTISISSLVQNKRWKAFVGNVTGRLTLDDGEGYTIFDWSQYTGSVGGEVYATRWSDAVNWSNINCTWGYLHDQSKYQNKSVIERENQALFLNNSDDNITTTFSSYNHSAIQIGSITIPANNCSSLRTYINGSQNNQDIFTEVILYDGTNETNGKIIYATIIDTTDQYGYRNDTNYDFQMIVPENGSPNWHSATAYYFYVELEEV